MMSDNFKLSSGEITYTGKTEPFVVSGDNYTLNGEPMISGKSYYLSHGDVVANTATLTTLAAKWEFKGD